MCVFLIEREFTLGNIIVFFLKVRADCLLCSYSSPFEMMWKGSELTRSPACARVCEAMLVAVQLIDIISEPWAERSPSAR